jgi:hypothetical protein
VSDNHLLAFTTFFLLLGARQAPCSREHPIVCTALFCTEPFLEQGGRCQTTAHVNQFLLAAKCSIQSSFFGIKILNAYFERKKFLFAI